MSGPWEDFAQDGPWLDYAPKKRLAAVDEPGTPEYQAKYSATSVPAGENFSAGVGKFLTDVGRGAGQYLGLTSRADVAESRATDAPLMKTTAGKVGYFGGGLGVTAPLMAIPGVNTVAGAGLFGAGLGALQPSESTAETLTNVAAGGVLGAAGQKLAQVVGNFAQRKIGERVAKKAAEKAGNSVRDATLDAARKAGYVVPPSTANPTAGNRIVESVSGKAQTQQSATFRNQSVTNRLMRQELGLGKSAPLNKATLHAVRAKASQVYKAIKGAGDIATDPQYLTELADLSRVADDIAASFPDLNIGSSEAIKTLQNGLQRDKFSANAAVELIKQLRKEASSNLSWMVNDPAKKALGLAQREAAGIVEDQVLRHLNATGKGALAAQFDKARMLIAKTYSVEGALNDATGNVVATKLATQLRKGKPLSGGIETAARFAAAFPKAAGEQLTSPGVSALDAMVGMGGGMTINPSLFAIPAARIAARSAVLSAPYQNAFLQPSYRAATNSLNLLSRSAPLAPAAGVLIPGYVQQQ